MINLLLYVVFLALIVYGGTMVEALGPKNGGGSGGGGGTLLISAVWTCSICSGKLWLELRGCSAGLLA